MSATILQPGEIEAPAGDIPFLRLPARDRFFGERAARFRRLAADHKLGEFLHFMGQLAEAQQAALTAFPAVPLPDAARLALGRQHGMPPLAARTWQRDPAWQQAMLEISDAVFPHAPRAAQDAITRLHRLEAGGVEQLADAVLDARFHDMDLALVPFIAAALQTYWAHLVTTLGPDAFGRTDMPNLCPACASAPVASIVRTGRAERGLRYLHCSLCGTEWHMVRAKCSNCENTRGIAYYGIEGDAGAVKAETCEECGSYLKILYLERDPHLEPTADDVASLALDILLDEKRLQRSGPNLFLVSA